MVVAQHVHHSDCGQASAEQLRLLCQTRPDQQAAIAATLNGQPITARVPLLYEVFRRRNEIVEHLLLLGLLARQVPVFAVLALASQVATATTPPFALGAYLAVER